MSEEEWRMFPPVRHFFVLESARFIPWSTVIEARRYLTDGDGGQPSYSNG